jgi:hypothetical protein
VHPTKREVHLVHQVTAPHSPAQPRTASRAQPRTAPHSLQNTAPRSPSQAPQHPPHKPSVHLVHQEEVVGAVQAKLRELLLGANASRSFYTQAMRLATRY